MTTLTVEWQDRWQWWHRIYPSAYAKGTMDDRAHEWYGIGRIYKHKKSGQIRLYSDHDQEGAQLSVNGYTPVTLRVRGRFGKLYLGFKEA